MKRLTLEGIAELAGVSRATVSRVVNDHPNVSDRVRARVQQVIAQTGYEQNRAARSLVSKRSNMIGLFIPLVGQSELFADPYYGKLIKGIAHECNTLNYILTLLIFDSRDAERTMFANVVNSAFLDGYIITASTLNNPFTAMLRQRQIPFVMVGRAADGEAICSVDADNIGGAYLATSHLIRTGYRRIAFVAPELNTAVGQDRLAGYRQAHRERGMGVDEALIVEGDFTFAGGVNAMRQLLPHQPDAVFGGSDLMALGAIQAVHDAGLRVPEDIAVMGFDDFPNAATATPPLTTIRQPVEQSGGIAVRTLIDNINIKDANPRRTILPVELVIRKSCGALG
jgi:LacI family transcriptional regulator